MNSVKEKGFISWKTSIRARPISLTKAPQEMYISLYPNQQDKVEYEVCTTDEDNRKIVHAQGKLIYEDPSLSGVAPGSHEAIHPMTHGISHPDSGAIHPVTHEVIHPANSLSHSSCQTIDIKAIRERCRASVGSAECYQMFQTRGISMARAFRPSGSFSTMEASSIVCLELPSRLETEFAEFILHPVLMDGALQTAVALAGSRESGSDTLYLPFTMGEVEIIRPLSPARYIYVTEENQFLNKSRAMRFNLQLADKAGQVLIRMKDFSLREKKVISYQLSVEKKVISDQLSVISKDSEKKVSRYQ